MADDWFGVRCIFRLGDARGYEERVTIWQAAGFAEAIAMAEADAATYADGRPHIEFLGLSQSFHMFEPPGQGVEVFSLIRESELGPDSYLHRFFDTGSERQQHVTLG
jgi:hypothetical protein